MDRRPGRGETRDGGRLAQSRLSALLAVAIAARGGRPKTTAEIRGLIRRLRKRILPWGAPKIQVIAFLKSTGLKPTRTSIRSPWQNGVAERWVGSCRRELLDHVIPLNEQHLGRLMRNYISYYGEDRIHDGLGKDTPNHRPVERKPNPRANVISRARLGGLHHRYDWSQAA